jgi:hypothetical protein
MWKVTVNAGLSKQSETDLSWSFSVDVGQVWYTTKACDA